jgi:hypothetical protein
MGVLSISCNTSVTAGGKVIKMSKAGTGQTTVVPAFGVGESEGLIIDTAGIKLLIAPGTVYQFNNPTNPNMSIDNIEQHNGLQGRGPV